MMGPGMGIENAEAELAAHYGCKPEQLLDENEVLWEVVIELLKAIGREHAINECGDLHAFGINKLQVLKSYLAVQGRFSQ